jgi:hypothetical protein
MRSLPVTLLLFLSVVSYAQNRPYVGAGIGLGSARIQCPNGNCDQSALGYKLFAGINFGNLITAEVSYLDLGKSNGNGTFASGSAYDASVRTRGFGLTAGHPFFLLPLLVLEPALGVCSSTAALKYSTYPDQNFNKTNLAYLAKLSLSYQVTPHGFARLMGDFTQTKPDTKSGSAMLISVGAVYKY